MLAAEDVVEFRAVPDDPDPHEKATVLLGAAAEDVVEFPILPDDPHEKATVLLGAAAEIEHALMAQYLYAGYSFTKASRIILDVAIEEMSHFMTVQNLLHLIGRPPQFGRQSFEAPDNEEERLFPFELKLEPLSKVSLAKYILAESPEHLPAEIDPSVMARIVELATEAGQKTINRVATLYGLLGVVFGTQYTLGELAGTGDPWYIRVNDMSADAAEFYGGRDKLHLPDSAFKGSSEPRQGSGRDWDRSEPRDIEEFRVHVVTDRKSALSSLRDIGLQGEGPSPQLVDGSHFKRFYNLFLGFFGADGMGTDPPEGIAAVPKGAEIVIDPAGSGDNVISNVASGRWARLADLRYAILLGSLELYLRTDPAERRDLRGWAFAEMAALAKLAEFLREMPRLASGAPLVAALPLNLPPWLPSAVEWDDLADAFGEAELLVAEIQAAGGVADDHRRLLLRMAAADGRKALEAKARGQHRTQRTRADSARDVLDWLAGAGNPGHSGVSPALGAGSQGRFWQLTRDDLVKVSVYGSKVTEPSGGGDAPLIGHLRSKWMPQRRPPLEQTDEEFVELEEWVRDGCPDDPIE